MPPLIVAVGASAIAAEAGAAAFAIGMGSFGAALVAGAAGFLVSSAGTMLIPDQKPPEEGEIVRWLP